MTMVDNMIRLGQVKTAAVIGVESLSKVTDWTDRNTCVLFGDGAGAVIVRAAEGEGTADDTGVWRPKYMRTVHSTKIYIRRAAFPRPRLRDISV